ncbi:polyamine ABC transporter substrate-binding protein [Mesorhizobium sp. INR15]|uniref:polyamine ABC transporter substrate-binding protein n=1 Tax=Mesorhizobium sp. INR15 TaxID=2654248 RepID=UPI00189675CC|nr:polyamine ABC transporter substrate-binding protein [Mesorhizobium sp. INR15]
MRIAIVAGMAAMLVAGASMPAWADDEKVVNVFNWSDYIAPDTAEKFEKETGIKVRYDVYDSNEILETKLLAGGTGYDVVYPSAYPFLKNQVAAGAFQPMDRAKVPNFAKLDPQALSLISMADPRNEHAVPYMMVTDGVGYNVKAVKARMADAPIDSLDMIFKVDVVKKFADCGVTILDAPTEILPIAMNYLGLDPHSTDPADLAKAEALLVSVRPYIRYFHSSKYINDLANGDICVALGWSGDVLQAHTRGVEAGNGVDVAYSIPKEGTVVNFDTMAVPKDAPHPDNGLLWINFNLRPDIAAANSNYVSYANPVPEARALMDPSVANNPGIYPPEAVRAKLVVVHTSDSKTLRVQNRIWTKIVSGQ